jgi:fibronectin-binding autotransporter adhesin
VTAKAQAPTALLTVLVAAALALAILPASASAAACPVNPGGSTTWLGGSGNFNTDANWSNGGPSAACDVFLTSAGSDVVTMTSGATMKSFTLGGSGSTPQLVISVQSPNTNLDATSTGITIAAGASVVLTCPPSPGECVGGGGGGASLNAGSSTITNAGTIRVDPASGTGASLGGSIINTGTIKIEQQTRHSNGTLVNKGVVEVADGKVLRSSTSSCGDSTGTIFRNDTGGTVVTAGSGTLDVVNYEQGNGSTVGTNPVQMPCGSLKYIGNGSSKVLAYGGFALSGEMQANQALTLTAASANTNAVLQSNFTNNGAITLTCPIAPGECSGGPGGGAGFNANGKAFSNAGTLTVAAASGTGAGLSGGLTNTGSLRFEQNAHLGGAVINKGLLEVADGKVATSSGSSCGDTSDFVKNDLGGQIKATGTGTLSVINYEQGAGTTGGPAPVQMSCGSLKYSGAGAGTVQLNGGVAMTGSLAAGQVLRIPASGAANTSPFASAGTIVLAGGTLNGSVTNTGRLTGVGTVTGSVENTTGTVAPGSSPGTLTVNGAYAQGAGGNLEVEIEGTETGKFDKLAVGGNTTLGGTLTLVPSTAFASGAPLGVGVDFLAYGGSRTGQFAQTVADPPLPCPRQFTLSYQDGAKKVTALLADSGANCGGGEEAGGGKGGGGDGGTGGGGGGTGPTSPPPPRPAASNTILKSHPGATVKTRKAKAKVTFTFAGDQPGVIFQCKLDKASFKSCRSPKTYKVKPGKHKFTVRAIGPGGTDPSPASFSFTVVRDQRPAPR